MNIDYRLLRKYVGLLKHKRIGQILSSYGLLGRKRAEKDYLEARRFFAFCDAVETLHENGVRMFFFHRIGALDGFVYDEKAQIRIREKRSFPVMSEDPKRYEEDLKELLGKEDVKHCVNDLAKISQVIKKDNRYVHEDIRGPLVNVTGGERFTAGAPAEGLDYSVYLYGRCGVFGYAVSDEETMPSFLQALYLKENRKVRVVNRGLWGGTDDCIFHDLIMDADGFLPGDQVIFYMKNLDEGLMEVLRKRGLECFEITGAWHDFDDAKHCFYDHPGHMNAVGYRHVAELIYEKTGNVKEAVIPQDGQVKPVSPYSRQDYIREEEDDSFRESVLAYVQGILKEHPVDDKALNGGIVMNCNPFTKGHRYLIEYAAAKVKTLFIFVVEENKSFFTFEDRFAMVKEGTKDLENVVVVPSGAFIISAMTFPEYFLKDYVREKNFDVSLDVEIFAKYIAPSLKITTRFVGEEPFDPVTENYNETMKRILPRYGMTLTEIPRLKRGDSEVINATQVRKLLENGELERILDYVPKTTYEIICKKYAGRFTEKPAGEKE